MFITKKIYIAILGFTSISQIGFAQIKSQSILLGGQVQYSNSANSMGVITQPEVDLKTASFNLSVGKAFKENSVYGLNLSYSPFNIKNFFNGTEYVSSKGNQHSIGLFYRKYKKLATDFYFFGEFGAAYAGGRIKSYDFSSTNTVSEKQSAARLSLTPGLSYKVLRKLHLEITIPSIADISYGSNKRNIISIEEIRQRRFSFNSSLSTGGLDNLGIGFRFVF
jgi:hypothetical protein